MSDIILHDQDNVDRRGFLKCMAWAGTGVLSTMYGGVTKSYGLSQVANGEVAPAVGALSFVHISYSHLGFSKAANKDVVGTLQAAVDKINALPTPPAFLIHTGDLSHLSKPTEFDTLAADFT